MRKFHTAVSFAIMIAVTMVVLGLFRHYRHQQHSEIPAVSMSLYAETPGHILLCI
ncbi:MAG TPA: hypothetical protein VF408_03885 [Sediminibacterium sp.]